MLHFYKINCRIVVIPDDSSKMLLYYISSAKKASLISLTSPFNGIYTCQHKFLRHNQYNAQGTKLISKKQQNLSSFLYAFLKVKNQLWAGFSLEGRIYKYVWNKIWIFDKCSIFLLFLELILFPVHYCFYHREKKVIS